LSQFYQNSLFQHQGTIAQWLEQLKKQLPSQALLCEFDPRMRIIYFFPFFPFIPFSQTGNPESYRFGDGNPESYRFDTGNPNNISRLPKPVGLTISFAVSGF
jgi:hypothetical protein